MHVNIISQTLATYENAEVCWKFYIHYALLLHKFTWTQVII